MSTKADRLNSWNNLTDEELVRDSLINAEAWVGGAPGLAPDDVMEIMQRRGLLGPAFCLTREGVRRARTAQEAAFEGDSE